MTDKLLIEAAHAASEGAAASRLRLGDLVELLHKLGEGGWRGVFDARPGDGVNDFASCVWTL